ncbi:MAG: ArgE/DapE family deacylase [Desulfobacteraceae bacterium]|jgi:succinyl-diaminopimelate desuccinylase
MGIDKVVLRREVSRRVENNREDLIGITQNLIRVPSVNPPGDYESISSMMFDYYKAEGLDPVIACAPKEEVEALGLTYPRPNVIALFEGKKHAPVFCLDAHMDVVGAGDEAMWAYPPFGAEIHDGKIYGRGAEDTKCHLAAQLIALRAIREANVELKGDLILSATVDDEIGAWPGMGYLIEKGFQEKGFRKPDFHIAGEPTSLELAGCLARGRLWYEIILKGIPAHGGNPNEGVNAIEKAIALANAVKAYPIKTDPLMGGDTINIGIIQGGEAINVVPSRCKITFDIRPSTKTEVVKDFMDKTIQALKKEDPDFVIEGMRLLNDRQTGGIGAKHQFVRVIQKVVEEMTGKSVTPAGNMAGYSSLGNAYWTSNSGVAGLMYGGGNFQRAHRVDEFIAIDELLETTKVFAGLIVELCA